MKRAYIKSVVGSLTISPMTKFAVDVGVVSTFTERRWFQVSVNFIHQSGAPDIRDYSDEYDFPPEGEGPIRTVFDPADWPAYTEGWVSGTYDLEVALFDPETYGDYDTASLADALTVT